MAEAEGWKVAKPTRVNQRYVLSMNAEGIAQAAVPERHAGHTHTRSTNCRAAALSILSGVEGRGRCVQSGPKQRLQSRSGASWETYSPWPISATVTERWGSAISEPSRRFPRTLACHKMPAATSCDTRP